MNVLVDPMDTHLVEVRYMVRLLRRLGFRASTTRSSEKFHVDPEGWSFDYPSPYQAIRLGVDCDLQLLGFCDRDLENDVRRAAELEISAPAEAAALWASIDRRGVDQAWVAPIATGQGIDVVAEHVGNYQHHPLWGMLVDQLWVR